MLAFVPLLLGQDDETEEEVFELSPFTVDARDDTGYRANSTLAGSRLNTKLRDVGAAISVMTSELFEDTGATDSQTLLSYGLNTETSGAQGNFAGGQPGSRGQNVDLSNERTNPQRGQRIRGLATADLTRNFFETDVAFDSYNTDRITVSRGPNSLLFGIGSPGGIINNATMRASLNDDFGEVSFRLGERWSHRESFNYNKVILEDRLAVRVAGLYDRFEYQQRPTFEEKRRAYVALESILFENEQSEVFDRTVLRGNYETGEVTSTPPMITPPGDGVTSWFETPNRADEAMTGTTFPSWVDDGTFQPKWTADQRPGLAGRGDYPGSVAPPNFIQIALVYEEPNALPGQTGSANTYGSEIEAVVERVLYRFNSSINLPTWDYYLNSSFYHQDWYPSFKTASLPLEIFDNENMSLSGTTNRVESDFYVNNIGLEQTFFGGKAGIELNYDKQQYDTLARLPFTAGGFAISFNDVLIDIQEYNNDGTPNPNVGRAVLVSSVGEPRASELMGADSEETSREASRATAFYDLDFTEGDRFGWLGRHIITGVVGQQSRDTTNRSWAAAWDSEDIDVGANEYHNHNLSGSRRQVVSRVYLTPPLHNDASIQSPSDVTISNYLTIPIPEDGDVFNARTYHKITNEIFVGPMETRVYPRAFSRERREIETEVLSMQSYLFNDHVVALYGYRTDTQQNFNNLVDAEFPNGARDFETSFNSLSPSLDAATGEVVAPEKGSTETFSLVAHVPDAWLDNIWSEGPRLSFHYSESENFNPVGVRTDIEGFVIDSPKGTTEEMGFSVESRNGRYSARFNWFETNLENDTATGVPNVHTQIGNWLTRFDRARDEGLTIEEALAVSTNSADNIARGLDYTGLWSSYEEGFQEIINLLPSRLHGIYNYRVDPDGEPRNDNDLIPNQSATRQFTTEGFEVEMVANITENWRTMLNIGQQESVQSQIAPLVAQVAKEMDQNLKNSPLLYMATTPSLGDGNYISMWNSFQFIPLLASLSQEGTVAQELREWRINAVSNYTFSEGRFAGLGVGGAIRYQSKASTGYPLSLDENGIALPVLDQPFWGPDQFNGDLWVSYGKKLFNDKVDWKIQLNMRNAFGDNDPIPVITNPNGELAIFRNSLPRETFLTNTFSF